MRQSITASATQFIGDVIPGRELESVGLNFEALKIQNHYPFNGEMHMGIDFQIIRSDTGQSIGCVGKKYHILQNQDVFAPIIKIANDVGAQYDGGGLVFGGSSCWMSFRLPFEIAVPGRPDDKFDTNIIVFNNFEGKANAFIATYTTRWFCMNQMLAIYRDQKAKRQNGASHLVHRIRHNSLGADRLKIAQTAFGDAIDQAKVTAEVFGQLDAIGMNLAQMREFVEVLLPVKGEDDTKEASTRLENQRDEIVSLFTRGAGNRGATKFDAAQAVTEWTNHYRSAKNTTNKKAAENRLMSTLVPDGDNDKLAMRALDILLNVQTKE